MEILYSPQFAREYRKFSEEIKRKAEKQEKIFRDNPFDARLKTHKLEGRLSEFWAFSIDFHHRVIFRFQEDDKVRFYAIGDHSLYRKL
ncbi:MAG: type II toxin-antitoxin system YoeB family toxin [Candidatus Pacebacteria bacterium]|nr:type II toxin-antitoxin system YoeB family toxin [Candidatus Paceibacterota bacterium]